MSISKKKLNEQKQKQQQQKHWLKPIVCIQATFILKMFPFLFFTPAILQPSHALVRQFFFLI